jgi:hypothetical protein
LSQQTPYPPQPGYGPQPGFPAPGYQPQKTNTMAILGLIFAFVFSPLGIVFSAVGLRQIKQRREGGRGLAIAGLVLSIVFVLIGIALFAVVIAVADEVADQTTVSAVPLDAPAENLEGVTAACEVIMPAMASLETDMAAVTTPEEYTAVITQLRGTMESAATASADEMFIADVQLLSDDLQEASDVVAAGADPTYLESALAEDSDQVAATCDLAGWTE